MSGLRYAIIRLAFETLAFSHLSGLIRAIAPARGVIFTLHRVLPDPIADFSPNSILQVTPKYLDAVIVRVRELGFDTVSMDEAIERLKSDKPKQRPFVVLTFDDAYRDNLKYALPILRARKCPFTMYVPTAFVDGVGEVWWKALEDIVAQRDALSVELDGEIEYHQCRTTGQKQVLFDRIYSRMRIMDEDARVVLIRDIASRAGLNLEDHCRSLILDWSELQIFADEPLCTIAAHAVHHYELSKLSPQRARSEIVESLRTLEIQLGERPRHFSYPIGSRVAAGEREYQMAKELGLTSAVTTLPGGLFRRHANTLWSLPRISLNGSFQSVRYVPVLITGALFSLIGRT